MNQSDEDPEAQAPDRADPDLAAVRFVRESTASASASAKARAQSPWTDGSPAVEMFQPHRTRARSLAARSTIALATTAALVAGIFAIQQRRIEDVKPTNTINISNSTARGNLSGPLTFLLIGSDSRKAIPQATNPSPERGRSDTIVLARFDPSDDLGVDVLWLPRDLQVDVPGHGISKINSAYSLGGPPLLVETIRANFDVEVDHVIDIGFDQFIALVDDLGGIRIRFNFEVRDRYSGLTQSVGCQVLGGSEALSLARARHLESFDQGEWRVDPTGDLGRMQRQTLVLAQIGRAARDNVGLDPAGVLREVLSHVTVDASLRGEHLAQFFEKIRGPRIALEILNVQAVANAMLVPTAEGITQLARFRAENSQPDVRTSGTQGPRSAPPASGARLLSTC